MKANTVEVDAGRLLVVTALLAHKAEVIALHCNEFLEFKRIGVRASSIGYKNDYRIENRNCCYGIDNLDCIRYFSRCYYPCYRARSI